MAAAIRSIVEWAASESMPSEPVKRPVTSLSRVMARAAQTETKAAVRFSAWGFCGVDWWKAAAGLIWESYRVLGWEMGEMAGFRGGEYFSCSGSKVRWCEPYRALVGDLWEICPTPPH